MGRLFNLDSPVMVFLSKMADLMILNIVMIIVCIPIITIGPALTAMHYVMLKMVRKEEGYLLKPFFKSFKENFKLATFSWMIILAFIIIFYLDLRIIDTSNVEFAGWLRAALITVGIIAFMTSLYVFPLIARFENNLRNTFKNAFFMSILNFPKTILMIIVCIAPIALVFINVSALLFVFLFGISAPGYLCAMLYSKVFKRFEPEDETIDADNWTVNLEDAEGEAEREKG